MTRAITRCVASDPERISTGAPILYYFSGRESFVARVHLGRLPIRAERNGRPTRSLDALVELSAAARKNASGGASAREGRQFRIAGARPDSCVTGSIGDALGNCMRRSGRGRERGRLDASPIFLPLPGGAANSFVDSVDSEIPSRFLALGTTRGWTFSRIRLERKKKKGDATRHQKDASIDARERKTSSRSLPEAADSPTRRRRRYRRLCDYRSRSLRSEFN